MTSPLRLEAPAKLNLSLAVIGRRDDGTHQLASVFVLLELADRLLLMPGCSGLRVDGADPGAVPPDTARNLAWRGLVAGMGQEPDLACLTLEKRVPAAAGLGGGSSDAAAAWWLGRRWSGGAESATDDELAALATIGADVPFFAAREAAAWVTGIGEHVTPLPAPQPPLEVVLVHPPFGLSTAAVFGELQRDEWSPQPMAPRTPVLGRNDLLAPARRLRPELDDLFARVRAAGGEPHLTGSGPTVFTMTDDEERAASVAARLTDGGDRVTLTRTRVAAASIEELEEEETT